MTDINRIKCLFWTYVLFASVITEGTTHNCERCVKMEECPSLSLINKGGPKVELVPCKIQQNTGGSTVDEVTSISEESHVCCPNLHTLEKENNISTDIPNSDSIKSVIKRSANPDRRPWQYGNKNKPSNSVLSLGDHCAAKASLLPNPDTLCCGINISELDDIVNNDVTKDIDMLPWTAFLISTFDQEEIYSCEGVLISRRHVLTAAHCVDKPRLVLQKVEVTLPVYGNNCAFRTMSDNPFETILYCYSKAAAERVIVHEKFQHEYLVNDIALIKLENQIPERYAAPVCLPTFNIDNKHLTDDLLIVTNWVTASNYKEALDFGIEKDRFVKQAHFVFHESHNACKRKYYPNLSLYHMCAVSRSKDKTPEGNSGSPVMMLHEGSYYLIGLVSSIGEITFDGKYGPPLYTNVHLYLEWIKDNIKKTEHLQVEYA